MGANIRAIRERLGLKQYEMAKVLGVTPGAISQYESNLVDFPSRHARALLHFAAGLGHQFSYDDIYAEPKAAAPSPETSQEAA